MTTGNFDNFLSCLDQSYYEPAIKFEEMGVLSYLLKNRLQHWKHQEHHVLFPHQESHRQAELARITNKTITYINTIAETVVFESQPSHQIPKFDHFF